MDKSEQSQEITQSQESNIESQKEQFFSQAVQQIQQQHTLITQSAQRMQDPSQKDQSSGKDDANENKIEIDKQQNLSSERQDQKNNMFVQSNSTKISSAVKKQKPLSLFKQKTAFCPYKNKAIFVCTERCQIQAMICQYQQCGCQKAHQLCQIMRISSLQQNINKNFRNYDNKVKWQKIKNIKFETQRLVIQIKNLQKLMTQKVHYLGLSEQQILFVKLWNEGIVAIKDKNPNNIFLSSTNICLQKAAGTFFKPVNQAKITNRNNLIQKNANILVKTLQSFQKKQNQYLKTLRQSIQNIQLNVSNKFFQHSSIIFAKNQEEKMIKLLPKFQSIQRILKLNQQSPKQNYWNKEIKQNTIYRNILVLIKNSYKKTFGAFISCNLNAPYNNLFITPEMKVAKQAKYQSKKEEQFMFSLTHNQKVNRVKQIEKDQWFFQSKFSGLNQSSERHLSDLYIKNKERNRHTLFNLQKSSFNFQVGNNRQITFLDEILFQKFDSLSEKDLTGVDSNYYSNSKVQIIQVYHVVFDPKQALSNLKVIEQKKETQIKANVFIAGNGHQNQSKFPSPKSFNFQPTTPLFGQPNLQPTTPLFGHLPNSQPTTSLFGHLPNIPSNSNRPDNIFKPAFK